MRGKRIQQAGLPGETTPPLPNPLPEGEGIKAAPSAASASAPGNMILMGEYAVLEGAPAVMMTLKHRLDVTIKQADKLTVVSDRFGTYDGAGEKPQHITLIENVLKSFFAVSGITPHAVHIEIQSAIPPVYGFGSSAALVAALVKALHDLHTKAEDFERMFIIGHAAILATFSRGSGADLAAALADMPFIVFDPERKTATAFPMPFAVHAIYTGYKTPTPVVLKQVRENIDDAAWHEITAKMRQCVKSFIARPSLEQIKEYQGYMNSLGVTCEACSKAINIFTACGMAAKISGSGRGDCVAGFSSGPPVSVPSVSLPLEYLPGEALRA